MARQSGVYVENGFIGGLNTEATALNFPEKAATETWNCIFDRKGRVQRRLGLEYETSYVLNALTAARTDLTTVSSYFWQGAGGDGDSNLFVIQVGQYIYFYTAADALSAGENATIIDLANHDVTGSTNPYMYPCSFAPADGKLFIVGRYIEPFYITYDPGTSTISDTNTAYHIRVRDTTGDTADPYGITDRPNTNAATVNESHLYNLYNQGWYYDVEGPSGAIVSPVDEWDSGRTDLPANDDRWWYHLDTSDQFATAVIDKASTRGGQAPRGTFIFEAFDIARGSISTGAGDEPLNDCSQASTTSSGFERVTHAVPFANRLFYAGCAAEKYNDVIYFSQVILDADRTNNTPDFLDSTTHLISEAGNCYQALDPTDKDFSDLLATDGGTIKIPEIASVVHLEEAGTSLIIFATNGIWAISGSEGIGFKATDFSIQKISNQQNTHNFSYLNINGTPVWINGQGIWSLVQSEIGNWRVESLSEGSIQSFFETIPGSSIPYIRGTFNSRENRIYWIYRSAASSDFSDNHEYDKCLIFDVQTRAFYPWDLNTDSTIRVIDIVTIYDDDLTTPSQTKFITEVTAGISAAEARDTTYKDWTIAKGAGGVDYSSYLITGYRLDGQGWTKFQDNFVNIYSEVEADSSLNFQGIWDFGGANTNSNRFTTTQEAYTHDANYEYTNTRLKVRGHGKAVQFKFTSTTGKPFNLIGWSAWVTANTGG